MKDETKVAPITWADIIPGDIVDIDGVRWGVQHFDKYEKAMAGVTVFKASLRSPTDPWVSMFVARLSYEPAQRVGHLDPKVVQRGAWAVALAAGQDA